MKKSILSIKKVNTGIGFRVWGSGLVCLCAPHFGYSVIVPLMAHSPTNDPINYLPYMNSKNKKHIHDHFFHESMSRITIAKGALQTFINTLILNTIDFSTFEIVKDDWISEKLKESRSDILYRAKLLNQNEWIYFLFEHKSGSSSDKNTPYQILRYMNQVWEEYKKQDTSSEKMPVIIPVIVYHGKKHWNIRNSVKPLFAITKETEKYVPDFQSEIIDLSRLIDNELGDQVELKAFLMALKYSRRTEILNVLPGIIRLFNSLGKSDGYLKEVLLYIGSLVDKSNVKEFLGIIEWNMLMECLICKL